MQFNTHESLKGRHSVLSPSSYRWAAYDEEQTFRYFRSYYSSMIGDSAHAFAASLIKKNIKLTKQDRKMLFFYLLEAGIPESALDINSLFPTVMSYVNDGIGFSMSPEQPLFYSYNCFGTADAISFENMVLRIHDLKTGSIPADMEQLMVYAALFCLEYYVRPEDIRTELRIYQDGRVVTFNPMPEDLYPIVEAIRQKDEMIGSWKGTVM